MKCYMLTLLNHLLKVTGYLINITTVKTVVHNIVIHGKYTTKYLLIIKLIFVKMRVSECNLLTFFFIYLLKHLKIDFC